jgi:hypothetical protein
VKGTRREALRAAREVQAVHASVGGPLRAELPLQVAPPRPHGSVCLTPEHVVARHGDLLGAPDARAGGHEARDAGAVADLLKVVAPPAPDPAVGAALYAPSASLRAISAPFARITAFAMGVPRAPS